MPRWIAMMSRVSVRARILTLAGLIGLALSAIGGVYLWGDEQSQAAFERFRAAREARQTAVSLDSAATRSAALVSSFVIERSAMTMEALTRAVTELAAAHAAIPSGIRSEETRRLGDAIAALSERITALQPQQAAMGWTHNEGLRGKVIADSAALEKAVTAMALRVEGMQAQRLLASVRNMRRIEAETGLAREPISTMLAEFDIEASRALRVADTVPIEAWERNDIKALINAFSLSFVAWSEADMTLRLILERATALLVQMQPDIDAFASRLDRRPSNLPSASSRRAITPSVW